MLEIVLVTRARGIELAELVEEIEPRTVELQPVLGGREVALESGPLSGLGLDSRPQLLDFLLVLADRRLELLLFRGATAAGVRLLRAVLVQERRLGVRHV